MRNSQRPKKPETHRRGNISWEKFIGCPSYFSFYARSKHFLSKLEFASNDLHKICFEDLQDPRWRTNNWSEFPRLTY